MFNKFFGRMLAFVAVAGLAAACSNTGTDNANAPAANRQQDAAPVAATFTPENYSGNVNVREWQVADNTILDMSTLEGFQTLINGHQPLSQTRRMNLDRAADGTITYTLHGSQDGSDSADVELAVIRTNAAGEILESRSALVENFAVTCARPHAPAAPAVAVGEGQAEVAPAGDDGAQGQEQGQVQAQTQAPVVESYVFCLSETEQLVKEEQVQEQVQVQEQKQEVKQEVKPEPVARTQAIQVIMDLTRDVIEQKQEQKQEVKVEEKVEEKAPVQEQKQEVKEEVKVEEKAPVQEQKQEVKEEVKAEEKPEVKAETKPAPEQK